MHFKILRHRWRSADDTIMEKLSSEQFEKLTGNASVIERDPYGPKVLETREGLIIKLFRLKRLISSARIRPYAVRFGKNAQRLRELGFRAPEVERIARCPAAERQLVAYKKLPGQPLRTALSAPDADARLFAKLAELIAELHARGVYFRSLHLGNILVQKGLALALIDIADMRLRKGSLSPQYRARNFRHLLRYPQDRALLAGYGFDRFLDGYLVAARLSAADAERFRRCLARIEASLASA